MFTNIKEWVLDRIEQSFELFFSSKENFFKLVLPVYLYKLIFWVIIWNFISYILLWNLDLEKTDIFSEPYYIFIFFIILVWFILYITFFIWFFLAIIKSIKDILEKKDIDIKKNLKYWFDRLIKSFNTYWYIFAYIVLWPFLFISIWWILILVWDFTSFKNFIELWTWILWFWFWFLLFFMIYRWVKTNFALVSAVDEDSYTKENFLLSVRITNNNWWRILWNFFLLSLLISLVFWLITSVLSSFKTWIFDVINWNDLLYWYANQSLTQNNVNEILNTIKTFYNTFYLNNFLISFLELFLNILWFVFTLIFTYLFYLRLKNENWIKKEEIEL
jgi:hypothetical protein